MSYELIVVGCSWGGLAALGRLLEHLPDEVDVPIAIAQHRGPDSLRGALQAALQRHLARPVVEAADKDPIEPGHVYVAPPDYHLLVEVGSFALSVDERVQHARPSIDVLFESAADAYGAAGLARIAARGGVAIVQDPETAEAREMPEAALAAAPATVLPLEGIGPLLGELTGVETRA